MIVPNIISPWLYQNDISETDCYRETYAGYGGDMVIDEFWDSFQTLHEIEQSRIESKVSSTTDYLTWDGWDAVSVCAFRTTTIIVEDVDVQTTTWPEMYYLLWGFGTKFGRSWPFLELNLGLTSPVKLALTAWGPGG